MTPGGVDTAVECFAPLMWPKPGLLRLSLPHSQWPIYQELCPGVLRSSGKPKDPAAPMTMSVANTAEDASPMRGLLPLWVGAGTYALFVLAGDQLLNDADTYWQITVGQWILDHRTVPQPDMYSVTMHGQPWISTQWLAQVMLAVCHSSAGWTGLVVLAA